MAAERVCASVSDRLRRGSAPFDCSYCPGGNRSNSSGGSRSESADGSGSCHIRVMLPCDSHVHSEWSWDTGGPASAAAGRMEQCCVRADKLGLQALAFTEHLDFTSWTVEPDDFLEDARRLIGSDNVIRPPVLDVEGYRSHIDRLRHRFPNLRILTGAELGTATP